MSLKEYLVEKAQVEANLFQSNQEAIRILQQAIQWLKAKGETAVPKPAATNNQSAKEIIAKSLSNIGTLDLITPANVEEEVPAEVPEEVPAAPVAPVAPAPAA